MENDYETKTKKIIELYEKVLYGKGENMGLFECYDTYYAGCWHKDLIQIDKIKKDLLRLGNK